MAAEKQQTSIIKVALIVATATAFGGFLIGLQNSGMVGFALGMAIATWSFGLPIGALLGLLMRMSNK